MHSFGFKVIPSEDGKTGVPVAVAGQSMVDIQRLLTDIGEMMVRLELRIQNEVPPEMLAKFDLSIGGSSGDGLGSDPKEGNETAMDDALAMLARTLDFLGKGLVDDWLTDNFPEPVGRARIAKDLIALADNLEGFTLVYGPAGSEREFRGLDREKLEPFADVRIDAVEGPFIGVVSKDPVRRNRWQIANGPEAVPVSFADNIDPRDVPAFAAAGPIIAMGTMVRDGDRVVEVRNVKGCYSFPDVKFHTIVTADRDIKLLNPSIARPSYDASKGLWTLTSDELGIEVSKPSWDEVSVSYSDYFAFLWETYYESDGEFEGEELEIREFLSSLAPVI